MASTEAAQSEFGFAPEDDYIQCNDADEKSAASKASKRNWKKTAPLPAAAKQAMNAWLRENQSKPYPEKDVKEKFMLTFGLTKQQVETFMINQRMRLLKRKRQSRYPMIIYSMECNGRMIFFASPTNRPVH